jgi:hypothetical protein
LAIHPLLVKIREECPNLISNSWYLDDGVVAGSKEDVLRALRIIESEGPGRGMFLNAGKSEVWNPAGVVPDELKHFKALQPEGFELLGSPVGSASFCQKYFDKKMVKFREVWANIQKLDHLQTQALLLRYCASFCKVVHLFRSVPPHMLSQQFALFDDEFRGAMESITGKMSDFTWAFMGLGCKKGGLGLRPSLLHALGGYLASFASAAGYMKLRFPAISEADIDSRLDFLKSAWSSAFGDLPEHLCQRELSARTDEKLLPLLTSSPACPPASWVASIQSPTSSCFWKCLPSRWSGTWINNACFRTLIQLRYRLAQLYPSECPVFGCTAALDPFGDHALCCKKGGEPTIRHNRLTQRIALECSKAVAGVSLEARLLLQKSDERPADILLTAWRGGAHALDVTVPHVITKRTPASAVGHHAMDEAISRKKKKYFARCEDAGLNFTVLAFDTLGATHPDTVCFLRRMFKDAKERELCPDWKSIPQAWNRVIVPLQVDVARQILTRSLPPSLEALSSPVFVAPALAVPSIAVMLEAPPAPLPLPPFCAGGSAFCADDPAPFCSGATTDVLDSLLPLLTVTDAPAPALCFESKAVDISPSFFSPPYSPTPLSRTCTYIPSPSAPCSSAFVLNYSTETKQVPVREAPSDHVISFQPIIDMTTGAPLSSAFSSRSAPPSPSTNLFCSSFRSVDAHDIHTHYTTVEKKEESSAHAPYDTIAKHIVMTRTEASTTPCAARAPQTLETQTTHSKKSQKVHLEARIEEKNHTRRVGRAPGVIKFGGGLGSAGDASIEVHCSPPHATSSTQGRNEVQSVCVGSSSSDYLSPSAIKSIQARLLKKVTFSATQHTHTTQRTHTHASAPGRSKCLPSSGACAAPVLHAITRFGGLWQCRCGATDCPMEPFGESVPEATSGGTAMTPQGPQLEACKLRCGDDARSQDAPVVESRPLSSSISKPSCVRHCYSSGTKKKTILKKKFI